MQMKEIKGCNKNKKIDVNKKRGLYISNKSGLYGLNGRFKVATCVVARRKSRVEQNFVVGCPNWALLGVAKYAQTINPPNPLTNYPSKSTYLING